MYGKFKNLKSCETACEITPTCFAGDFDPYKKQCFLHSNVTACEGQTPSKGITHFRKVPCSKLDESLFRTARGTFIKFCADMDKKCYVAATINYSCLCCVKILYSFDNTWNDFFFKGLTHYGYLIWHVIF